MVHRARSSANQVTVGRGQQTYVTRGRGVSSYANMAALRTSPVGAADVARHYYVTVTSLATNNSLHLCTPILLGELKFSKMLNKK